MIKKNALISEIISLIKRISQQQNRISFSNLDSNALKKGVEVSANALAQPEDIALTPYTANMLEHFDGHDNLTVYSKTSKMEKYIEVETLKLLRKYCKSEVLDYDPKGQPGQQDNYDVDCGRNFKRGSDIRHAFPNMNKAREEGFSKFYKPFTKDGSFEESLKRHPMQGDLVLPLLDKMIPEVYSSSHGMEVNLPFMNKHTNVGYPYYMNDKATLNGKRLSDITSDIARKLKPKDVVNYPYVAFGRNLRGKARPILGGSRIQALVFNQLESKEISTYKEKSPLFIGYNDDTIIREKMIRLAKWLEANPDFTCYNRDYSAFDTTVKPGLRRFVDAYSVIKAVDKKGKDIAFGRGVSHFKSLLSNGLTGRVVPIYDRILSGEIDTNRGGGLVNAIADMISITTFYPSGVEKANDVLKFGTSPLGVMGDDNLLVQPRSLNNKEFSKFVDTEFGLDVSDTKGEYGLFFLQRRLFKRHDGSGIMITPFTRIIRSLATKENRKGLGPAGGTVASYMLLYQLIEGPELMCDVAKIFLKFDKFKLGLRGSVKQLTQLVAKEDKEAALKDKRMIKTVDRLYDGDPLKSGFFNSDGSLNESYLSKIHSLLLRGLRSSLK